MAWIREDLYTNKVIEAMTPLKQEEKQNGNMTNWIGYDPNNDQVNQNIVTFKQEEYLKKVKKVKIIATALIIAAVLFAGFYFLGPFLDAPVLNHAITEMHQVPAWACGCLASLYGLAGIGYWGKVVKTYNSEALKKQPSENLGFF